MATKEPKVVKIMLDKERNLKFTLNSLVYAEELGVDVQAMGKNESVKLKDLRVLLFAGLMHEDKELTEVAVGEMITMDNMKNITTALTQAFGSAGK
jgi:hypothetical protein